MTPNGVDFSFSSWISLETVTVMMTMIITHADMKGRCMWSKSCLAGITFLEGNVQEQVLLANLQMHLVSAARQLQLPSASVYKPNRLFLWQSTQCIACRLYCKTQAYLVGIEQCSCLGVSQLTVCACRNVQAEWRRELFASQVHFKSAAAFTHAIIWQYQGCTQVLIFTKLLPRQPLGNSNDPPGNPPASLFVVKHMCAYACTGAVCICRLRHRLQLHVM